MKGYKTKHRNDSGQKDSGGIRIQCLPFQHYVESNNEQAEIEAYSCGTYVNQSFRANRTGSRGRPTNHKSFPNSSSPSSVLC
jgi:hypothetical protein